MRCFIAANPPRSWHVLLEKAQKKLAVYFQPNAIKWTTPAQWHLTLQFLGDITSENVDFLCNQLEKLKFPDSPINLNLGTWGVFPNKRKPRVLWIGLSGDTQTLAAIQSKVAAASDSLIMNEQPHNYQPHLTLGRIRKEFKVPSHANIESTHLMADLYPINWKLNQFHLYQSQLNPTGPVYSRLQTFKW